jgi:hypothetical protein
MGRVVEALCNQDEDICVDAKLVAYTLSAYSLLKICQSKCTAALGKKDPRAFGYAVAVGIALDDRNDTAGGALFGYLCGNRAVIVPDCGGVNLHPRARRAAKGKVSVGYIKIMLHENTPKIH